MDESPLTPLSLLLSESSVDDDYDDNNTADADSGLAEDEEAASRSKKTYRFEVELSVSSYELNFLAMVANAESKEKFVQTSAEYLGLSSDNAKKHDVKVKRQRKIDDCADLGYDYGNSEVYESANATTLHDGFFMNAGPLELEAHESADEDPGAKKSIAEHAEKTPTVDSAKPSPTSSARAYLDMSSLYSDKVVALFGLGLRAPKYKSPRQDPVAPKKRKREVWIVRPTGSQK